MLFYIILVSFHSQIKWHCILLEVTSTMAEDPLAEVENKRALLEENVATLRKTLQLWQKWSFEYEALKEEVDALPVGASASELKRVGHAFEGDVLNRKEIDELLGLDKGASRSAEQVSSLLSRRLDYVIQNVGTVQKQLDATELKLADMGSDEIPFVKQDDLLPVTEILEELDEEGNVVSSKLSRPGEETSGLVDVLKKAGIKDDDLHQSQEAGEGSAEAVKPSSIAATPDTSDKTVTTPPPSAASQIDEPQRKEVPTAKTKSVKFTEDTKPESQIPATSHKFSPKSPSPLSSQVSQSSPSQPEPSKTKVYTNFAPQNRVIELNDQDEEIGSTAPIIPIDESDEDAAMRREMLAYSMNEMGSIVAQLDLEESYYSNEDDEEDDDDDDEEEGDDYGTATDDEEETEFGMSTKGAMDEEYRKEMLELEARLGARYFENLGPQAAGEADGDGESVDVQQLATHTARVAVKDDEDMPKRPARPSTQEPSSVAAIATAGDTVPKAKKGVRFAEDLDVAPTPSKPLPTAPAPTRTPPTTSATPGVRDTILERTPTVSSTSAPPSPEAAPPKISRFKAGRAAAATKPPIPGISRLTTPTDSPILSKVVERAPAPPSTSTTPSEPDELDPEMLRKQVAEEYYKQRNRRIAKQGGFRQDVQDEQEMDYDADEYENGDVRDLVEEGEEGEEGEEEAPRKMSLFKKARLKRGQGW